MLDPAVYLALDAVGGQPLLQLLLDVGEELGVAGGDALQLLLHFLIADGVQVAQGDVLQLPLDALHT